MTWSTLYLLWRLGKLEWRVLRIGLGALEWAAARVRLTR